MTDRVAPEELMEWVRNALETEGQGWAMTDEATRKVLTMLSGVAQHIERLEGENERLQGYNDDAIRATRRAEAESERLRQNLVLAADTLETLVPLLGKIEPLSAALTLQGMASFPLNNGVRDALTTSSHSAPKEGT